MSSLASGAGDALPDGDGVADGSTDGSASDGCSVSSGAVGLADDDGLPVGGGAVVQAATITANRIMRVPQLTVEVCHAATLSVADRRRQRAG
jgi:hypothetical protein